MIERGLGCLPDSPSVKGSHAFEDVCGVALVDYQGPESERDLSTGIPDSVDLSHLCPPVRNQGGTKTCYAWGWRHAITQAARREDPTFEPPSALLIADMTRGLLGQRGIDIGAPLGAVEIALRTCGFAPESAVPWDESRIFDHIYADEYQAAICQIGLRSHRLFTDIKAGVKTALAAGRGVVIGIDVDQSFVDFTGGAVWEGMTGPRLGGHAVSLCGYSSRGVVVFNSWGSDWGGAGFATLSWEVIEGAGSIWIVDAAPEYWREAA